MRTCTRYLYWCTLRSIGLFPCNPIRTRFCCRKILIFSGLFGILSPNDSIPAYRLAMGTKLPNLGNNKTLWKHELKDFSAGNRELVIDCRSGSYQVWNPPESADWITVTAVRDKNGQRKVISHNTKYFRGLLANALIKSQIDIEDGEQLTEFVLTNLAGNSKIDSAELTPAAANGARKLILVQKC
ncbi:peroxide stress protein YaaA [Arcanobacterium hippocoleae]